MNMPEEIWRKLDGLLANFRAWIQNPTINCVLRRSAYANPQQRGFPAALASIVKRTMVPQKVEQERRFLVRDGDKFWNGSLDRIVWLGDGARSVAADLIDFKTDAIQPGDEKALGERKEHYRPQVEAYRRVVARMARLPEEHVAARLVFTIAGRIVDL
jgi:ATP-dependent exoDNAse (exonuclease V) beta subunit